MQRELLLRGGRYDVYLLLDHRGRSAVRDEVLTSHLTEQKQFLARLQRLADKGPELTPHYLSLADSHTGVWYLRASKHLRIWFRIYDDEVILLSALHKTKRETDPIGLQRALRVKALYDANEGDA